MSLDFKRMMEFLLKQKEELSAEEVKDMIEEKKRKVGAGYLTDQGALFLVAADLGISFDNIQRSESHIKDIFIGAKDVNLSARILSIYPIKKFTRRETNEEIKNRTLTIYDKDDSIKVKLWDNQVDFPENVGLKPGNLVKIGQGYIKSGIDNKPILNIGIKGYIKISDESSEIPTIESRTIKVNEIIRPVDNVIIEGVVNSNPRISQFNNMRNELSKSLQFHLTDENKKNAVRVIIWNVDESKIPKILKIGTNVRLIGVKIKEGNPQYSSDEYEVHGDEGTEIETLVESDIDMILMKILTMKNNYPENKVDCLALDKNGDLLSLVIDSTLLDDNINENTIIECIPTKIFGNSLILSDEDALIRIAQDEKDLFDNTLEPESKIKDVQISDKPYIIEAIVLQMPNVSEVNTRTGELVPVTDTIIGDDTGEIRVVGWREHSKIINKLNVGDRIKLIGGVATMGRENKIEIVLKSYSSCEKIS